MDDFREFKVLLNNKADHLKIILTGIVTLKSTEMWGNSIYPRAA